MFWLAAAGLLALALVFVGWPLISARAAEVRSAASRRAEMRALYRDRLAELEAEAAAGQVDAETRQQVLDELGANLLDEYQTAEAASAASAPKVGRRSAVAVWVLLALVPLAGIGVYLSTGEPDAVRLAGASRVLQLDPRTDRAELEAWRTRLARRVERVPEDGQSWYLLGISRLQLADFAGAADAFARAHRFVGGDPNVALYWLQARYLASGGEIDEQSRGLAARVLQARPNHPLVLEMFAIDAYRRGDYQGAVQHLNRALGSPLPAGQQNALLQGLDQARSRMGTLTPTIDVAVQAPEAAPRQGALFVIARPPGGGVPVAVVRRPADMLPVSVRLDDTVSMAGQKLSGAAEIQVVVRLSPSGNPTGGPGDWEWRSGVLRPAELSDPLTLTAALEPVNAGES